MADDNKTLTLPEDVTDNVTQEEGIIPVPLSITVDDGLRMVPINNKMGQQIGVFAFRPTDVDIITRFNEMARRWEDEVRKPLDAVDNALDVTDSEAQAALQTAKDNLFALCDYAFGGNLSEAFFGSMNPFSFVDGNLYCENVLSAVGDFLEKVFDRETAKISNRAKKYMPTRDHLKKGGKRRT